MKISTWLFPVALCGAFACQPPQGVGHEAPTVDSPNTLEPFGSARANTSVNSAVKLVATSVQATDVPASSTQSDGIQADGVHNSNEGQGPPTLVQAAVLADMDPNNDGEVAPPSERVGCLDELTRNEALFASADIPFSQQRGNVFTCGATQVVVYKGRPSSPKYNTSPRLTCRMALGLIQFEELAQKLAQKHFGAAIRRIEQGGTYSCRKMARFVNLVSEHSYANAIDIKSLLLSNGKTISVKRHFGDLAAPPTTPASAFLRELASSLYDQGVFSVVLTPYFDSLHHDHFHFDQARYRVNGTR
jgi:hypothetical protein